VPTIAERIRAPAPGYTLDRQDEAPRWLMTAGQTQAGEDSTRGEYTAVVKQEGDWWIGWIEEIPGVNCQERSHEELMETLEVTLREALELNREDAIRSAVPRHTEIHDNLARKICKDLGVEPPK